MQVSQNFTKKVTHSIAAEKTGFAYQAHVKAKHDVISIAWLQQCQKEKQFVPLRPHHHLYLSEATIAGMTDVDQYGDR